MGLRLFDPPGVLLLPWSGCEANHGQPWCSSSSVHLEGEVDCRPPVSFAGRQTRWGSRHMSISCGVVLSPPHPEQLLGGFCRGLVLLVYPVRGGQDVSLAHQPIWLTRPQFVCTGWQSPSAVGGGKGRKITFS